MTRMWTARVKEITILGRMNDVNVQVKMDVDYAEGVNGIDVVKQITAYWHAGGMEPPVNGAKQSYRTTGERNGANGQHPDDLKPHLNRDGSQENCPNCGKPLYYVEGTTTKKDSPNFGKPWKKWFCPKAKGGCGAYNFGDRKETRFD